MNVLEVLARDAISRAGQYALELVLGILGASILVDLWLGYELSIAGIIGTSVLVMGFGLPLLAGVTVARYARSRIGSNRIAKAATSLIMATGIYNLAIGGSRLAAFYGPFIGAEFQNAREWGGYGPIEAVPYVLEGIVWSYETVRLVFPDASRSFELGAIVLVVGIVLEASRYGISRKVKA